MCFQLKDKTYKLKDNFLLTQVEEPTLVEDSPTATQPPDSPPPDSPTQPDSPTPDVDECRCSGCRLKLICAMHGCILCGEATQVEEDGQDVDGF